MENILDHFEEEKKGIYEYDSNIVNENNYLQRFWGEPRQAFAYLLNKDNRDSVIILFGVTALIGILVGGDFLSYFSNFEIDNRFLIAGINGISNTLLIVFFIFLYYKVGQWFGGEGTLMAVATVSLWASIPNYILSVVGEIPDFFGLLNISTPAFFNDFGFLFTGFFGIINFIVSIWTLILSVVGLSVAHKFSNGNAITTYIVSALFFVLPIVLIALNFGSL